MAESFIVHRVPIRVGIVFSVNADKSVTGMTDGGVALLNAFNFISEDKKPSEALSFITDVSTLPLTPDFVWCIYACTQKLEYIYHSL